MTQDKGPSELWQLNLQDSQVWLEQELGEILGHQLLLDLPAAFSLAGPIQQRVRELAASALPPIHSLQDLLSHPNPPADLIATLGQQAWSLLNKSDTGMPRDVGGVVFHSLWAKSIQTELPRRFGPRELDRKSGLAERIGMGAGFPSPACGRGA